MEEEYDYCEEFEVLNIEPHIADTLEFMSIRDFDRWLRTDRYGLVNTYYNKESLLLIYNKVKEYRELGKHQDYILFLLNKFFSNKKNK